MCKTMKRKILAIAVSLFAFSANAELSNAEFAEKVKQEKAEMKANKDSVKDAAELCNKLPAARASEEPKCVALQQHRTETYSNWKDVEW